KENKAGVSNLLTIYAACQNISITEAEATFADKQYGDFKKAVAETVTTKLTPIQERYETLIHSDELDDILRDGAKKANEVANETLIHSDELDDILRDGAKKANEVANETLQIAKQKMGI